MMWNRSDAGRVKSAASAPARKSGKNLSLACVVVAGVVVIGIIALYFVTGEKEDVVERMKKPSVITEVKPDLAETTGVEEVAPKPETSKSEPNLRDKRLSPEQKDELYEKQLKTISLPEASSNRLFRSGLEQVMGWIFTTEIGDMPPPLPHISDFDIVHMEEILNEKNSIRETDSERTAETKKTVEFAKKELKEYLAKGGDPQEFLEYYHDVLAQAFQTRQEAQKQAILVMKEDPDSALEYVDLVNKSLKEKGIKGISISMRALRRYGITPPNTTIEEGNENNE